MLFLFVCFLLISISADITYSYWDPKIDYSHFLASHELQIVFRGRAVSGGASGGHLQAGTSIPESICITQSTQISSQLELIGMGSSIRRLSYTLFSQKLLCSQELWRYKQMPLRVMYFTASSYSSCQVLSMTDSSSVPDLLSSWTWNLDPSSGTYFALFPR